MQAAQLWAFDIQREHLHLRQMQREGRTCMYVALLLPVPLSFGGARGPGDPGLREFPVWHGRGCGPHISILYNVILPQPPEPAAEERQWQMFHEIRVRLWRWLVGPTTMLLCSCTPARFTVSPQCQLHAQLRCARAEILEQMKLVESWQVEEQEGQGSSLADQQFTDFHITWIHWAWDR